MGNNSSIGWGLANGLAGIFGVSAGGPVSELSDKLSESNSKLAKMQEENTEILFQNILTNDKALLDDIKSQNKELKKYIDFNNELLFEKEMSASLSILIIAGLVFSLIVYTLLKK
jgi:hypothetical protein